jgi:hypothetical protein
MTISWTKGTCVKDGFAESASLIRCRYLLSAFHTISINPGEKPQALHHDDGYIQFPRPRMPFGSAIMVAFDEYTEANGKCWYPGDSTRM